MPFIAGVPIYYGYNGSPFVSKLETLLLIKNIPARRVDVAQFPPRPELSKSLGIPYRRVPVLALGRDIYADTALIATVLERRFPASQGHPTLFPARKGSDATDVGLQKAFSQFYADKALFTLGFQLLPWKKTPQELQADRKQALYEEQLRDGREWFMDTESPGLVDASIHTFINWCRSFRDTRPIFDEAKFPRTVAWLNRIDAFLKQKRQASPPSLSKMSSADATKEILSAPFLDISAVGFDKVEAQRLGLVMGSKVAIRPDDTGKEAETTGKLIAFNREEIVIETAAEGERVSVRVHFPRLGYVIRDVRAVASKL